MTAATCYQCMHSIGSDNGLICTFKRIPIRCHLFVREPGTMEPEPTEEE